MDCCYGCGNEALFIFKNGKQCCSKTKNQCSAIRTKISQKSMGRTPSKIQITKLNNFRELKLIEMKQFYLDYGCELLEDEYKNVHTKMKYRCKCGDICIASYRVFKHSKQCKNCSFDKVHENQRLGIDNAKKIFSDGGCTCLENEYINSYALMRYICSCGNESKISLNNFKRGVRCKECGDKKFSEKTSGTNHWNWSGGAHEIDIIKLRKSSQSIIKKFRRKNKINGRDIHIDHIYPIIAFVEHGIFDLDIINSDDNLQILTRFENCSKGGKYNTEDFQTYLNSKGINYASQ